MHTTLLGTIGSGRLGVMHLSVDVHVVAVANRHVRSILVADGFLACKCRAALLVDASLHRR